MRPARACFPRVGHGMPPHAGRQGGSLSRDRPVRPAVARRGSSFREVNRARNRPLAVCRFARRRAGHAGALLGSRGRAESSRCGTADSRPRPARRLRRRAVRPVRGGFERHCNLVDAGRPDHLLHSRSGRLRNSRGHIAGRELHAGFRPQDTRWRVLSATIDTVAGRARIRAGRLRAIRIGLGRTAGCLRSAGADRKPGSEYGFSTPRISGSA